MNLQPQDRIFVDHPDRDGVTLTDPVVWRARPGGNGQPPQQANITSEVAEVTVSSQTITITGVDGTRARAAHAPESSPGMRTGIVERDYALDTPIMRYEEPQPIRSPVCRLSDPLCGVAAVLLAACLWAVARFEGELLAPHRSP